jgi:hypothetical protein
MRDCIDYGLNPKHTANVRRLASVGQSLRTAACHPPRPFGFVNVTRAEAKYLPPLTTLSGGQKAFTNPP